MPSWRPDRSMTLQVTQPHPGQGDVSTLFLWIVPADVRGVWRRGSQRVRIEQNYQDIDVDGTRGTLAGSVITWGKFRGRVDGDRIVADDGTALTRER
jgi:hypothetical protein